MTDPKTGQDVLAMSDEEFIKMGVPPVVEAPSSSSDEPKPEENPLQEDKDPDPVVEQDDAEKGNEDETDQTKADEQAETDEVKADAGTKKDTIPSGSSEADKADKAKLPVEKDKDGKPIEKKPEEKKPETNEAPTKFEVPVSFKANGKTIELKTPEEALKLMQMGANYTKRMQDLQPVKKLVTMLENNGLLDEGKLAYLIDLDKKNPEAIKKLIKDSGIDPLEIDTSVEPAYREGSHRVSDNEVEFRTHLDELSSTEEGKALLQTINTWDNTSKEALWNEPSLLTAFNQQRETGVFDLISTEVERRRTLGEIPANTPFIQAYKMVGDDLTAQAKSRGVVATTQAPKPATPVATTVATPVKTVDNGDKASAAAATRTSPREAKKLTNPLAMSDEDFLKQVAGRL